MPNETKTDPASMMQLIINAILALTNLAIKLGEVAKQDAELTPEQDAKLDADIAGLKDLAHWKVQ